MRREWRLVVVWAALLGGCGNDPDRDGLSTERERELGLDPRTADTDGDGLLDGAEVDEHGTDPLMPDTDGDGLLDGAEVVQLGTDPHHHDTDDDGYLDPWEVAEGSDPTNPDSVIYRGGWPYNPDKDAFGDPRPTTALVGESVPRFQKIDQFGDVVDIYDFADGKPIVLDLSGLWCVWCHRLADFIDRKPSPLDGTPEAIAMACLPDAVAAGDVHWITLIYAGTSTSELAGRADVDAWYAEHPSEHVAVLLDRDRTAFDWFSTSSFPSVVVVDSTTMTVQTSSATNYAWSLGALCTSL